MESLFKIATSQAWEEAKITGTIMAGLGDEKDGICLVNFESLEKFANQMFRPEDYPIALEFSPVSLEADIEWREPSKEKPWKEAILKRDRMIADDVLSIYSFIAEESDSGFEFRLLGEE